MTTLVDQTRLDSKVFELWREQLHSRVAKLAGARCIALPQLCIKLNQRILSSAGEASAISTTRLRGGKE